MFWGTVCDRKQRADTGYSYISDGVPPMIRASCTEMVLERGRRAQGRFGARCIKVLRHKPNEKAGRQNQICPSSNLNTCANLSVS